VPALSVRCTIEADRLARSAALCARYDVTLLMFLADGGGDSPRPLSDETDIVMGMPVAGRVHPISSR